MMTYEFHVYAATEDGDVSADPVDVQAFTCTDATAAKNIARKLAKGAKAPVDVAREGPSPWNDRYLGTAAPHPFGGRPRFERLD